MDEIDAVMCELQSQLTGWMENAVRAQKQSDFSTTNIVDSYARHEQHVHVLLCPHQPRCSELQQYLSYPRTTVEWNAVHAADHQDCCGMEPPRNTAVQAQSVNHTQRSSSLLLLPPSISIGHPRVRALPTPLRQCQRSRCKQCTVHQLQACVCVLASVDRTTLSSSSLPCRTLPCTPSLAGFNALRRFTGCIIICNVMIQIESGRCESRPGAATAILLGVTLTLEPGDCIPLKKKTGGGCYFLSFSVYLSVVNSSLCGNKGN